MIVWQDGRLIEGPLAVDPNDRGLLLGDGCFETIAVHGGKAIWRDDHVERLMRALEFFGIPAARDTIEQGIDAVLGQAEGILRLTVTRGPVARGLGRDGDRPSIIATLSPWIEDFELAPAKLATATTRRNESSAATRHKTLSYIDNILAAHEVAPATEALMLNSQGRVACSSVANIFLLKDRLLITPSESEGALPGIARKKLLDAADQLDLACQVRPVEAKELTRDTALFLTNSLRLIRPVNELDGRPVTPLGPMFDRMVEALRNTGERP